MKTNKLIDELKWRGLLKDITNEKSLENIISNKDKFYIGIDPTADSIHLGHFLSLSLVRILNSHGLKPVIVIGGFTGMIGDPSGRNSERDVIDRDIVKNNVLKIKNQITNILNKMKVNDFEIFDNNEIYSNMSLIDFYQKYGKLFNVNNMLSKESVKNRMDNGISYTEFSYQIFQSIDFMKLYENKNVKLQLGGSDQWGNITAGIDFIRKIHGQEIDLAGITINLLTDENGNKIGKTQGKPIWLDINKTSAYEIYQYFINQSDDTAKKLLSQATSINYEDFTNISSKHLQNTKAKLIQNKLAEIFISEIHSIDEYKIAKELSQILFSGSYEQISEDHIKNLKSLPEIKNNDNLSLMELSIQDNKIASRRIYREFLKNNAIKINGNTITTEDYIIDNKDYLLNKVSFITIGKKNKYLIWK